jgi:hypothetical protein
MSDLLGSDKKDNGGNGGGDGGAKNVAGADQVKSTIDQENEQGFRGSAVDKTPNHAYTVAGVTSGEETPETKTEKKDSNESK